MSKDTNRGLTRDEIIQRVKAKALANEKIGGCSQSVLQSLQEELGIANMESFKSATMLGGGLKQGETCGAFIGALMGLGLVCGRERIEEVIENPGKYERAVQFARELSNTFREELQTQFGFRQEMKSTLCPDIQERILGRSFDMWNERQAFIDAGGHSDTGCPKVCAIAAQVAAQKILEIRNA